MQRGMRISKLCRQQTLMTGQHIHMKSQRAGDYEEYCTPGLIPSAKRQKWTERFFRLGITTDSSIVCQAHPLSAIQRKTLSSFPAQSSNNGSRLPETEEGQIYPQLIQQIFCSNCLMFTEVWNSHWTIHSSMEGGLGGINRQSPFPNRPHSFCTTEIVVRGRWWIRYVSLFLGREHSWHKIPSITREEYR
jgi:hypothetical protein